MTVDSLFVGLGACVLASPALLLAAVGSASLLSRPLGEGATARWTAWSVAAGLASALAVLALMLATGSRHVVVELGDWARVPEEDFHFHLKFVFDRLSVPFLILTLVLAGATGAFARRYLHRDPGYGRFFLSFAVFLFGMVVAALAGSIETLFLGWEFVGLSSVMLVAFFHERPSPVLNGQRIWSIYRISDAAFLLAAVVIHHVSGTGDFTGMTGTGPWPEGRAALTSGQASAAGLLLLLAAAGKSGLVPFSGWLPRAMEGPTPSSAVFYGALSVHLGAYLLLRVSPILESSPLLGAATAALGLATAAFASVAGRVQSDAKGVLAFASLTQVGIITTEIGLGLRYIPLIHIIGHACLRTLQLLRAPSLLHDHQTLEDAVGGRLGPGDRPGGRWLSERRWRELYRFGFDRGRLDDVLDRLVAAPFVRVFRRFDRWERRWTDLLAGQASREPDRTNSPGPIGEEA